MKNRLEVRRSDFVSACKPFSKVDLRADAMLAFEGGFLSIEANEQAVVVRADGQWQGRARFSANILRAIAKVPPAGDPVVIEFADNRLRVGTLVIGCRWETVSARFIQELKNPDYLDLMAMDRTLPRSEIRSKRLDRQIRNAKATLAGRIAKAAKLLVMADVKEDDLWQLVERNIQVRIKLKDE
jgi:hypothetical protein